VHDRSWLAGFPRWMGTGGEGQPALVDLQGTGRLDMVFGDSSGFIHALDPSTGREIMGWPQVTRPVSVLRSHQAVDPGFEPVVADVAVGDLNHTGHPSVVATSIDGRVYVFDAQGNLQAGWPKTLDLGVKRLPIPRPVLQYTRLPVQGAVAPPVLYDLTGKGKLDVIQAGWDGYIHVWSPDGSDVPGWPVKVKMPAGFTPDPGYVLVNDQKLDTPPAVAFLEGRDQPPDLVMRPQYTETVGGGLQPNPFGFVFAYHADGSRIQGWPVKMPGTLEYYGSAQEFITEGNAAPAAADVTGTGLGPDDIAVGPVFSPPYLIDGSGHIVSTYQAGGSDPPIAFTTSGAFGKVGGVMSFVQAETGSASLAQALLQPNSGAAINEYEVAYPAAGGGARPGFPAIRQGIDFLGEPIVSDVTGDGQGSVVDGGDSNAMHAYTSVGGLAAGFPKWTSGWNLFSPAAGDLLGTGKTDLVSLTREGYVFAWGTPGLASANTEWWRGQHDEWNSGNYEAQTRPARRPVISPASLPSPEGPRCCRRGR